MCLKIMGLGQSETGALDRPLPVTPAYLPTPTPELPDAGDQDTEPTEPGPLGKSSSTPRS